MEYKKILMIVALMFTINILSAQDYLIYSVSPQVSSILKGKKTTLKKGDKIDDRTLVEIPVGSSIQIINLNEKVVYSLQGEKRGLIKILVKQANAPLSATGKFLTFIQQESMGSSSHGIHEQVAGATFREDSLLIAQDSIDVSPTFNVTDSVEFK